MGNKVGDGSEDLFHFRNLERPVELLAVLGVEVEIGLAFIPDAIGRGRDIMNSRSRRLRRPDLAATTSKHPSRHHTGSAAPESSVIHIAILNRRPP